LAARGLAFVAWSQLHLIRPCERQAARGDTGSFFDDAAFNSFHRTRNHSLSKEKSRREKTLARNALRIPEQYHHPRFDEAVRTIFRIARAHQVGAGIHYWLGLDQEIIWVNAGGNLVMHSSDLAAFSRTLKSEIGQLRNALGTSHGG
jgi:hypothetical protein